MSSGLRRVNRLHLSEQVGLALERAPADLPYRRLSRIVAETLEYDLAQPSDLAAVAAVVERVCISLETPADDESAAVALIDLVGRAGAIDRRIRGLMAVAERLAASCGTAFGVSIVGQGTSLDRSFSMDYRVDLRPTVFIGSRALHLSRLPELVGSLGHEVAHITTGSGWRIRAVRAARDLVLERLGAVRVDEIQALCSQLFVGEELGADDAGGALVGDRAILQAQLGVDRINELILARAQARGRPAPVEPAKAAWPTHPSRRMRADRLRNRMTRGR